MDATREQAFTLLRQQLQGWEHTFHGIPAQRISSGCSDFDHFLPQKGFCTGQLVEWLGTRASGAETLALLVARQAAQLHGAEAIVIIDEDQDFYPPAAMAWGIDLQRLIIVRPPFTNTNQRVNTNRTPHPQTGTSRRAQRARIHPDLLWALDQSLRCPAVAAVWARLPSIDPRDFRRLQLAAEEGNALGLLLRDPSERGQPSWSDLQLLVTARPTPTPMVADRSAIRSLDRGAIHDTRRCCVQLIRSRQGAAGASIELEIQENTRRIQTVPRTSRAESRSA